MPRLTAPSTLRVCGALIASTVSLVGEVPRPLCLYFALGAERVAKHREPVAPVASQNATCHVHARAWQTLLCARLTRLQLHPVVTR